MYFQTWDMPSLFFELHTSEKLEILDMLLITVSMEIIVITAAKCQPQYPYNYIIYCNVHLFNKRHITLSIHMILSINTFITTYNT